MLMAARSEGVMACRPEGTVYCGRRMKQWREEAMGARATVTAEE
jgi:hypothetical protein